MGKRRTGWSLVLLVISVLSLFSFIPNGSVKVSPGGASAIDTGDTAWMLACAGLVLLMTPGLGFFYGGMVSSRSSISTILQSFAAMGVLSLVWLVCGFSLAFGTSICGIIGNPFTYFMFSDVGGAPNPVMGATVPFMLFAIFQMKFAIIAPALFTGALAERVKFGSILVFMALWSIVVYSPLAHATWHPDGIFMQWGVLDFAGGTVVHIAAGMAALAGAIFIGPRVSHQRGEDEVQSNIPFVILGTGLLWFGWFGFNAGSSLRANEVGAQAFLNTNISSSTAMLVWLALDGLRGKKPSALGACIGAVVGLVAITPAAGFVPVSASMPIGAIASAISNTLVTHRKRLPFDDALDVFACHGVGGMVGMLLTAVFARQGGLVNGSVALLMLHSLALVIAAGYSFCMSYVLLVVVNRFAPLRVTAAEEREGLDKSQHDEVALGYSYGLSLIGEISEHLRDVDYRTKSPGPDSGSLDAPSSQDVH